MDPTTVTPPPPPPPPQNPHTPTDAVIEPSSTFDPFHTADPSTRRNMNNFKSLVFKLAGKLSPANRSLVHRRFDDIVPDELLVPDHPPYADMILTALWELKAEGGSSEEDISQYIKNEYRELPWAHATILSHHLKDLCKNGKITMTHDQCYLLCSSVNEPEFSSSPTPSPSPSPSLSPLSSSPSSSSTSFCTSPSSSSSSSSSSWGGPKQRRKRKKKKTNTKRRRGKMVQVSSRRRGGGRGVGQRRNAKGRFDVEESNEVEETKQGTEDRNEGASMEVEDCSNKDIDFVDISAKISEEENLPCEQSNKKQSRPQNKYNVTWVGRRSRKLTEDEIAFLNGQSVDEVINVEDDFSDPKVDDRVEQAEQKEEKGATDVELKRNQQEENQQYDIVERRSLGEERVMDNENVFEEQDLVMMRCETQVTDASVEKQHGDTLEEQIQPEETKEECAVKTEESDMLLDCLTKEQVETRAHSAYLHDDVIEKQHDDTVEGRIQPEDNKEEWVEKTADLHDSSGADDVTEELVLPQEQCVEDTEESLESCKQDQLRNVDIKSAGQDEQQTDVSQKEISSAEVQKEPFVVTNEQQNQSCIMQIKTSEKDSHQEITNPMKNDENLTSSGSTTNGLKRPSRQGLRSSSKKEDPAPNSDSKKQVVLATPVRRSLRSNNLISEAAVATGVGVKSAEQKQCIQNIEESFRSCKQDQLKNVEVQSAEQEEQQTEVNQTEIISTEVQQEPFVEMTEQQNQSSILQTITAEKDSHQEKINPVKNDETSSGSTTDRLRRPLRQGLRSSSKKEDAAPNSDSKKQLEPVHPQEQCVENTEESIRSCQQDQLKNVEVESAEQEEHQTDVKAKRIVSAEVQQEPFVEMIKQHNQPCIPHTETFDEDSHQEKTNPAKNYKKLMSSGSTTDGLRRALRQGLRSSSKNEDAALKSDSKKQLEQVHPQEQCVENTEESLHSCKQDQLKNVDTESTEQEEQQLEVNLKEISSNEVKQEAFIETTEQQNQSCIQQTDTSEKNSHQENTNLVKNDENMTSSGSATDGLRRPLRQRLRSSSKNEDAATISDTEKQLELVTPVRRSLRSNSLISEEAVVTEVPDHSKEQATHSGRTRSSKRKTEIAEVEQVTNTRKTRRTGL